MKHLTLTVPVRDGKCQFTVAQLELVRTVLSRFNGRTVSVSWSKPKSTRSIKANAYYWAAVLGTIAAETGNSTEDLHIAFRDMLLPRKFIKIGSKELEVSKTTTDLSPSEFNEYVTRVCAEAAQMGIRIPEAT